MGESKRSISMEFVARITLPPRQNQEHLGQIGVGRGNSAREALKELWYDCEIEIRDEFKAEAAAGWQTITNYRLTLLKGEQVTLTTYGETIHDAIDLALELELKSRKKETRKVQMPPLKSLSVGQHLGS
jgi:hypothetical protein